MYAAILAGGTGTRMGNINKPKQFLMLNNKPILIHTLEKFKLFDEIKIILVLVPKKWINYTNDIICKYGLNEDNVMILEGGKLRNDTILNAVKYIKNNFEITEKDSIITHDSVRPFVTYKIIKENIDAMEQYVAADTVIPSTDTIVSSIDGKTVNTIPDRRNMYMGQTPQTFRIKKFEEYYKRIDEDEKEQLTDAIKLFVGKDDKIALIKGDETNIKITYSSDLKIAKKMIKTD